MKPLIIIPARGGSKGVPRKNIKLLNSIPLIHYTIKAAQQLFDNTLICVSTDDEEIKKVAEQTDLVVPFLRPNELASDNSGTYEVLLHAIDFYKKNGYEADTIILLQPTSPFRTSFHIEEALKLYSNEIDMVVSVKETKSNPYYILFEENESGFLIKSKEATFTRRQDCPKVWEFNGAIYIINIASLKKNTIGEFKKVIKYEMDEFSSHDIDTLFDWDMAELIIKYNVK
ncbi:MULTISPECIES: cytidylyltransferase domain-containing protein [unclassified Flavobacterium]|uniref:acylneuraminate cytidylyltransferase family protein n=1 Tax=unclassified Flavobacterium TaxID=196869 RepID=UPI001291A659|nr:MULTISPECIES: acylneuraminate cytidylyltransferase family protein [unclassified Flavobacterium]MQP52067.1 acylneuraminate cytidylyltransferase family protein [Flavobacterium sp. LMO9]MQP61936.1 acylneuraminate cytidylyltransferase family protein [Flavobacterium sp. LMO6]